MLVNILCQNYNADRVIPRFSRYLADNLGWILTEKPDPAADIYYLSGYFEWPAAQSRISPGRPVAAYFTHFDEQPGSLKAKLFLELGQSIDLRLVTAAMYAEKLANFGPTYQVPAPVEQDRFVIPANQSSRQTIIGLSGYTYRSGRKGEALARQLAESRLGRHLVWKASGRGWSVPTKKYRWKEMPSFYQSLDILVVTSLVEGVPMPPLEALACGVSIVIPRNVGLLDELPNASGIYRYNRGEYKSLELAFEQAVKNRRDVDRQALRVVIEPYSVSTWCKTHKAIFQKVFDNA